MPCSCFNLPLQPPGSATSIVVPLSVMKARKARLCLR